MTTTVNHIKALFEGIRNLPQKDQAFAESLLNAYHRYGSVSPKQAHWVEVLAKRASGQEEKPAAVAIGNLSGVIALFAKAREHLDFPKIVLVVDDGHRGFTELKLSVAGDKARFPGTVNVADNLPFGQARFFGRINLDGSFEPSRHVEGELQGRIVALLQAFAANPAEVAAAHGKLTGNCCFCHRQLTDERSTAIGYGPVCADNYGLPWGAKAAAEPAAWPVALEAPETKLSRLTPRAASLVALAAKLEGNRAE